MQQKVQSACRGSQPGTATDVGELPDVETGTLPVPHINHTSPENDELQSTAGNSRTCGDPDKATGNGCRKHSAAAGVMIFFIRIYQKAISPWLPRCCRFEPSCSHYAVEAFQKRGFWVGSILTAWRLLRCQPFGKSGFDPVPENGFRNPASVKPLTPQEK